MSIIANDPYLQNADVAAHGATPVSFGELIEQADYLVIQRHPSPHRRKT